MTSPIVLATRSGSEFIIHPNGMIERMSLVSLRFTEFAPAGTVIDQLVEGLPCTGRNPAGEKFSTSPVLLMAYLP